MTTAQPDDGLPYERNAFWRSVADLPGEIEVMRERGMEVTFPREALPANPEKRESVLRLLKTLGVSLR